MWGKQPYTGSRKFYERCIEPCEGSKKIGGRKPYTGDRQNFQTILLILYPTDTTHLTIQKSSQNCRKIRKGEKSINTFAK